MLVGCDGYIFQGRVTPPRAMLRAQRLDDLAVNLEQRLKNIQDRARRDDAGTKPVVFD